jgi:large subunit ribosomal protein L25
MDVTLTAETGREIGSGAAGRLRQAGTIPGVVYGLGKPAVAVAVPWTELRRALTTEQGINALIKLNVDGTSDLTMVKDMQRDPVRRDVLHVDFLRVDPDITLEVEVTVVLVGEAEELHREGGIVEQAMNSLIVSAKPAAIPSEIEVDISGLTMDHPIKASAIVLPEGVTTDVDPDDPVATGFIPRAVLEGDEEGAEGVEGEGVEGEAAEGEAGEGGDSSGDAESD